MENEKSSSQARLSFILHSQFSILNSPDALLFPPAPTAIPFALRGL